MKDGERVATAEVVDALTRASFIYADGATQVFTRDGRTTYTENGRPSSGEWGVEGAEDQGRFWSFWPPTYRASYTVSWMADADGAAVGIRFTEVERGTTFEGRYAGKPG